MGAECYSATRTFMPKCPNCGKREGYRSSSEWSHGAFVCSVQCGIRLQKKIDNGMKPWPEMLPWESDRILDLRIRIKIERARVRALRRASGTDTPVGEK